MFFKTPSFIVLLINQLPQLHFSLLSLSLSGTMAWGVYQINSAVNYKFAKKEFKSDVGWKLLKPQYNKLSRLMQRSFVNGKEYGGWLNDDGSITANKTNLIDFHEDNTSPLNGNSINFHTHPNNGKGYSFGHSTDQKWNYKTEQHVKIGDIQWDLDHNTSSIVFGRTNIFYHEIMADPNNVSVNFMFSKYFNPYPFNTFLNY